MKNILLIVVLVSLIFAQEPPSRVGVNVSSKNRDIAYVLFLPLPQNQTLAIEGALDLQTLKDAYLNMSFLRKELWFNICGRINYLASSYQKVEILLGLQFGNKDLGLTLGVGRNDVSTFPYLLLSSTFGKLEPSISWEQDVKFSLFYLLESEEEMVQEYFTLITPYKISATCYDEILFKGYYLDKGNIFINGREAALRADGMFIEKVKLPVIGINEVHIVVHGKNIPYYEYVAKVTRDYPFLDIDVNLQKDWMPLLDKVGGFKQSVFNPTQNVTKKEYYLTLCKAISMDKKKNYTTTNFKDVKDPELKDYLSALNYKGFLNGDYNNFYPDNFIDRKEALVVMSKFISVSLDVQQNVFEDLPTNNWAYEDVNKLANSKVISESVVNLDEPLNRLDLYIYLSKLIKCDLNILQAPATAEEKGVRNDGKKRTEAIKNELTKTNKPNVMMGMASSIIGDVLNLEKNRNKNSLADVVINFPTSDSRVNNNFIRVNGTAPAGVELKINDSKLVVGSNKKYSKIVNLTPGVNNILITSGEDKRKFSVIYIRSFKDMPANDYFSVIIEKIMTLGFINVGEYFYAAKNVTNKELFQALNKIGYVKDEQLRKNADGDKVVSYKAAVALINKVAGVSIQADAGGDGLLTRKVFALLLYELPKVKEEYAKYFRDNT